VFQNLIGNAVQHMGRPEGHVSISALELGDDLEFQVQDDGPGIEASHFERIFRVFQTLGRDEERQSAGIGLAVVKKVVEARGGHVAVSSVVGEGSLFRVTIPRRPPGT
jgi:signal transduction histidine kinase